MNKRNFLKKSLLGLSALALNNPVYSLEIQKKLKPGIILNTLKDDMKSDYRGTLERLAKLGYKYIESNPYGNDIEAYAKLLRTLGLKTISSGSSIANLEKETDQYIRNAHLLGQKYIVAYWPWKSSAENLTKDECLKTADYLNKIGAQLKKEGIDFAWHNHDKEFRNIGEEKLPFDYLMQETDPKLVNVQMDVYWVVKGRADPITFIKKYPGRFPLFHVKDMDNAEEKNKACVGEGIIDFEAIFAFSKLAGLKFPIVEQESNKRGFACAEVSYKNLIKWI
ncbi:MAG: sugar phosphate isomerase/epimerase [Bacteroidota bacterium]